MNIYYINKQNVANVQKPRVLVMGFFDGIHEGHLSLFKQSQTSLLTFCKIPRKTCTLYNLEDRIEQFNELNLENLYIFDILNNNITAKKFIETILKPLDPQKIIVGANFSFGCDHQSAYFLKQFFHNVEIVNIQKKISSSTLRYWLTASKPNFKKINRKLLLPYFRTGKVLQGYQDGRKIGIKTANIDLDVNLIDLIDGVYITKILLKNQWYHSLTFIGKPKTIHHDKTFIETWIMDYNGSDFYGEKIKIVFLKFLRKPKKFPSLMKLLVAIKKDSIKAKKYFEKNDS